MHWKKSFRVQTSLSKSKSPTIDRNTPTPVWSTSNQLRETILVPSSQPNLGPDAGSCNLFITHIRANDITVDLGRIPVGFFVAVEFEGIEWRTKNKPILVCDHNIEWDDEISLPSELSSTIHLRVCASYELSPVLGKGETLRTFTLDVGGLFQGDEVVDSIEFSPSEGEQTSPCSLLRITVEQRVRSSDVSGHVPSQQNYTLISEVTSHLAQVTDKGHEYLFRYRKFKKPADLKHSIACFEQALQEYPHADQYRAVALFNLASAQFVSCEAGVTSPDFDIPITFYRDALDLRPIGHPDRPATLFYLARTLDSRFRKWGDESYAEEAKSLFAQVKGICSVDSFEYQLADGMLRECAPSEVTGGSSTNSSPIIEPRRDALHTQDPHPQEPGKLTARAFALLGRFGQDGRLDDINGSIAAMEQAVELTRESDPEWALRTISLGVIILGRFDVFKNVEDLERSILMLDKVVQRVHYDHPDRPIGLIVLGGIVFRRFEQLGRVADVNRSLLVLEEALGLITNDHPNRSALFVRLGAAFLQHYQHSDNPGRLDLSISLLEKADAISPSVHCVDLPAQCSTRSETLGILFHDQTIKYMRLLNLGLALLLRFQHSMDRADLEKGIMMQEEALKIAPQNLRVYSLAVLGNTMVIRHVFEGNTTDLQKSMSMLTEALQLAPNHYRSLIMAPFGLSLQQRFNQLGQVLDIDQSIAMEETALEHTSDYALHKPSLFTNLSRSLLQRSRHLGDVADLDKATFMIKEAARLTPPDHPSRVEQLVILGAARTARFELLGNLADLNESIATLEEAVQLTSNNSLHRANVLANLAGALTLRSLHMGNVMDTEKSISVSKEVVSLLSSENPLFPRVLNILGRCFLVRFMQLGNMTDVEESISTMKKAVDLTPEGHSGRPMLLGTTAISFWSLFLVSGSLSALRSAISYSSCAARSRTSGGRPSEQFQAFKVWFQCAISLRRVSYSEANQVLLEAFECGIGLFPQLAWLGLPFKDRYTKLLEAADITRSAVSLAISLGHLAKAVEWLEQGRCVVWGQSLQLRTPLDELRRTYPDIADKFERLSATLQLSSSTRGECLGEEGQRESLEQQARRHRELVVERERLLQQIQALPGFEGFFSPEKFSRLRVSARLGPIILLNVGVDHGDALIVVADLDEPIHVPLPDINEDQADHLRTSLDHLLSNDGRVVSRDNPHRAARVGRGGQGGFDFILSELWMKVVAPILYALALFKPGNPTRVFWCPTGPLSFLPIHAAGRYDIPGTGNKASDFVISSYIPTLSVLSPPTERITASNAIRLLAVPQPDSDGEIRLSGTSAEMEYIREAVFKLSSSHVQLHESDGDVERVLDAMARSDWVHFACHGIQDATSPTDSGLCLADGRRLRLSDILRLSRPRGGLAFLSACQTATGAVELSEEAVHLAAGMLFAGYSSVIGTMWSITDSVAPRLARDVYEQLFRDGGAPDSREAARALHNAVERLRQSGAPFVAWLPFIHMGA